MKKLIIVFLALVLAVVFLACGAPVAADGVDEAPAVVRRIRVPADEAFRMETLPEATR